MAKFNIGDRVVPTYFERQTGLEKGKTYTVSHLNATGSQIGLVELPHEGTWIVGRFELAPAEQPAPTCHYGGGPHSDDCPSTPAPSVAAEREAWDKFAADLPKQGIKLDGAKPALDLVDPYFLEEVGRVLTFGARKYEPDNWRRGMFLGKVLAGVLRHVVAILRGEHVDPETGLQHAAHATCGLMFAFHYIRTGQTTVPDDRWSEVKS